MGVFLTYFLPTNAGVAEIQDRLLLASTFYELGYETTKTYHRGGSLTLNVNCSGSTFGLYSAKINLHFTGEDSYYYYRINGGTEQSGGAKPGCEFFTGWQERSLEPGFFREGNNSLQILVYNCPISDQTSSLNKYLIILPDSYIEIYDASATESNSLSESLTTTITVVSSETSVLSSSIDGFIGGLIVGAVLTGGILAGWYFLYSKRNGMKAPAKRFVSRIPINHICSICKQNIMTDQLIECPNCQNAFHETHFAEAIKTTGQCPICKSNIITMDSGYTTWSQENDK